MSIQPSRPVLFGGLAASVLFAIVILRLQPAAASGPAPLGDAQLPAAITSAAFAADQDPMPAIHAEAQRRLLVAHHYLGDLGEVLPAPLRHLYVIISYEQVIRAQVDLAQLPVMTAPPTPVLPPVDDLIDAYRALQEEDLAYLAEQLAESPSSKLTGQFLTAMAKPEIRQQRLAFAQAHQDDIVPR